MSVPVLLDGAGRPVSIGPRLGIGGEGTVYALSEHEVAKIYTTAPVPQRVAKLEALVRAASPDVRTIAAWPQQILRERSGRVTGFTMPRIEGRVSLATARLRETWISQPHVACGKAALRLPGFIAVAIETRPSMRGIVKPVTRPDRSRRMR